MAGIIMIHDNIVSQEAFEQLKIEDMWAGLKAHASKELNKADAHIRILKVHYTINAQIVTHSLISHQGESSPSVRECMELYDEPIVCDPYTGKVYAILPSLLSLRSAIF